MIVAYADVFFFSYSVAYQQCVNGRILTAETAVQLSRVKARCDGNFQP